MAEEFCEEYASSLKDLTFNSKPHISMLTMLAEENVQYAPQIVKVVEAHLQKVKPEAKLPTLYLIDSIMKNVGQVYQSLFTQNIVSNFCSVFEKVDEKVRAQMYKLRQTWTDIFPNKKLYAIDVRVKEMDPAWPILAQPPPQSSIHVNPRFLKPPPEEVNLVKKSQELQEEEMRQQLLAKQQELLKLQRQKLELELLQTQVLVEEQKRQLILKEQQLRGQPGTAPEVQKSLALQHLTNVAAFAAAAASQGLSGNLEHQKAKPGKGIQQPGAQIGSNKDQPFPTISTGQIELSQSVMPNLMVNNKTIDINKHTKTGFPNVAAVSQSQFMPNVIAQASYSVATTANTTTVCNVKPVSAIAIVGKPNLPSVGASAVSPVQNLKQTNSVKNNESLIESGRLQSKIVSPKISPKKGMEKSNKDIQKNKDTSKKQTPSPKKNKSKQSGKSTDSKGSPGNTERRDRKESKESSTKTSVREKEKRSRSKSGSISPIRNKTENFNRNQGRKSDHWQSQRDRRSTSHSRSRSPGKLEKNRDREDRIQKRGRRSPRREKENDGAISEKRNKTLESSKDVDLRAPSTSAVDQSSKTLKRENRGESVDGIALATTKQVEEPPYKKTKTGDADLDEIFSGKDQDYRQLDRPVPKLSPIGDHHGGWAQYKASRPDEFKNALRSRDNDQQEVFGFGKHDQDLRTTGVMRNERSSFWNRDPRAPGIGGRDPRMLRNDRRNSLGTRFSHPNDQRSFSRGVLYQATRESDPSIPRALMFDRGAEIMKQADHQLRSGLLTIDQHREIMEQLAKLYELQRMRHIQREQRMRESLARCSPEPMEVITISPDSSPVRECNDACEKAVGKVLVDVDASDNDCGKLSESVVNAGSTSEDMPVVNIERKKENDDAKQSVSFNSSESDKEVPNSTEAMAAQSELENKDPQRKPSNADDEVENHPGLKSVVRREEISSKSGEMKTGIIEPEVPCRPFSTTLASTVSNVQHRSFGKNMPIHTVMIDDVPREVRFFDDVAVVLLDNNDPREIAFRGPPQEIIVGKQVVRLGFQDKSKEFEIDGHRHSIRFGAPTREVIIDNTPYSAVFGGPPIVVTLNGKRYDVRLCGPTPEVYFGDHPRFDLLPQVMETRGRNEGPGRDLANPPLIKERESGASSGRMGSPLRWVTSTIGRDYEPRDWRHSSRDGPASFPRNSGRDDRRDDWRHSRFNDESFRHDRGRFREDRRAHNRGNFRDFDHWDRQDRQEPQWDDFRPGTRGPIPPLQGDRGPNGRRGSPQNDFFDREARNSPYRDSPEPRQGFYQDNRFPQGHPSMGIQGMPPMNQPHRFDGPNGPIPGMTPGGPHPMPPHSGMANQGMRYGPPLGFPCGPPGSHGPRFPPQSHPSDFPYTSQHPQHVLPGAPAQFHPPVPISQPTINVNELFEKLVATGIIPQVSNSTEKKDAEEEEEEGGRGEETTKEPNPDESKIQTEKMPVIELNPESLKIKHTVVTSLLYCGIQCSSCGVRFTAEQTDKYAQHLDWHFRQNRREKDSARKALSRKWYYDVQDWVQFEEIEDLEERARSFFELQAHEEQTEVGEDVQLSVPAGENEEDKCCVVCHELFELYWNEDNEEWHFKDAVKHEEKNYHPLCYEDFKEQQLKEASVDSKLNESSENKEVPENVEEDTKLVKNETEQSTENIVDCLQKEISDITVTESVPNIKDEVEVMDTVDDDRPMISDDMPVEKTSQEPPQEEHETLEVFNVLSSSYTVPPLIGMETEESPSDNMEDDAKEALIADSSDLSIKQEPETESKTVNGENNVGTGDVTVTADKTDFAVNEPVEQDEGVMLSDTLEREPEESDENEVVGGIIEMDISSFSEVVPEILDNKELVKNETVEKISEPDSQGDIALNSIKQENLIDTNVTSNEMETGASNEMSVVKNECDALIPVIPAVVDSVSVVSTNVAMDEDVSLKESSDIISEFAFEQPVSSPFDVNQPSVEPSVPSGAIEQTPTELIHPEQDAPIESTATDSPELNVSESLEHKPNVKTESSIGEPCESNSSETDQLNQGVAVELNPEEDGKDENGLKIKTDGRFTILPPVSRGTELSGLCSIM